MSRGSGWQRVAPGMAIYARDGWRIQRQSNGWRWWYVIQEPLVARSPRGVAKTLRAAMDAVDREIRGTARTTSDSDSGPTREGA